MLTRANRCVQWKDSVFSGVEVVLFHGDFVGFKRISMGVAWNLQPQLWQYWGSAFATPERGDPVPCFRLSYVTPSDGYDLAAQRLRKAIWGADDFDEDL